MKYRAKPFADVAVDRFAKGVGAALLIVAINFAGFSWSQLSYLSITVAVLWIAMALRARREYLRSFRQSLETRVMPPRTDARPHSTPVTAAILKVKTKTDKSIGMLPTYGMRSARNI